MDNAFTATTLPMTPKIGTNGEAEPPCVRPPGTKKTVSGQTEYSSDEDGDEEKNSKVFLFFDDPLSFRSEVGRRPHCTHQKWE